MSRIYHDIWNLKRKRKPEKVQNNRLNLWLHNEYNKIKRKVRMVNRLSARNSAISILKHSVTSN